MTEDDEMWTTEREPHNNWIARAEKALDQMFSGDEMGGDLAIFHSDDHTISTRVLHFSAVISVSAHLGTVYSILEIIGRSWYELPTGGYSSIYFSIT